MGQYLLSSIPLDLEEYDSGIIRNVFEQVVLSHPDFDPKPNTFFVNSDWNVLVDNFYENLIYLKNQSFAWNSIIPGINRYNWIKTTQEKLKKIELKDDVVYGMGTNIIYIISSTGNGIENGEIIDTIDKSPLDDFFELRDFTLCDDKLFVVEGNYVFSWEYPSLKFNGYFGGFGGSGEKAKFYTPSAIASDNEYIYVADTGNKSVKIYNHNFKFRCRISLPYSPTAIAVNQNYIFVGNTDSRILYRFEKCCLKNFTVVQIPDKFNLRAIRTDSHQEGFLYLVSNNNTAIKYTQDGLFITYFRELNNGGILDVYRSGLDVAILGVDQTVANYLDYSYKISGLVNGSCSAIAASSAHIEDDELNSSWISYNNSLEKMYGDLSCFTESITGALVGQYSYRTNSIVSIDIVPESYTLDAENIRKCIFFGETDPFVWEVVSRPWRVFYDELVKLKDFYNLQINAGSTPLEFECIPLGGYRASSPQERTSDSFPITFKELNPYGNKFSFNYFCPSGETLTSTCFNSWSAFDCLFNKQNVTWGEVFTACDVKCISGIKWSDVVSCSSIELEPLLTSYTPNYSSVVVSQKEQDPVVLYWDENDFSFNSISGHSLLWYQDRWRYYLNETLIENLGNSLIHPMSGSFLEDTDTTIVFSASSDIFACYKQILLSRNTTKVVEALFPLKYTDFKDNDRNYNGNGCIYENSNWNLSYNLSLNVWDLSSKHIPAVWIYPTTYSRNTSAVIPLDFEDAMEFCMDGRSKDYSYGKTITLQISAI
jgi:hypothetical protein